MGIFNIEEIKIKIIEEKLKKVFDPEIPTNVYDLGLIYKVELREEKHYLYVDIDMTLTTPACPIADALLSQVKYAVESLVEVDECNVNLVFDPIWDMSKITKDGQEELSLNAGVNF